MFLIAYVLYSCIPHQPYDCITPINSPSGRIAWVRLSITKERSDSYRTALSQHARDGNIAIREEFDSAMQSQGIDELELFIKRHPDHELAEDAQKEIRARKDE